MKSREPLSIGTPALGLLILFSVMKRSPFQDQMPSLCLAPDRSAVAHVLVRTHLAPRCSAFCGPGRLRRGRSSWQSSIRAATLLGLDPAFCSFLALDKVLDILGVGEEPQRDTLQSSSKLSNMLLFWFSWTHQASFRFRIHEEPEWMVAAYPRAH